VFSIKKIENDFDFFLTDFELDWLIIVMAVNVLDLGVLIEDKFFCLVGAMYLAVVP
jgi:hypothetical protein